MEKLLQLLNEYCGLAKKPKIISYSKSLDLFVNEQQIFIESETVISKKFGFIQWLVDDNKIDIQWAKNILYESEIFNSLPYTNLEERLIMYMSISDDPIRFLVSIIKEDENN